MGNSNDVGGRVLSVDTTNPSEELISSGYLCDVCKGEIYLGTSMRMSENEFSLCSVHYLVSC
jgi:hypothetical protein